LGEEEEVYVVYIRNFSVENKSEIE